VRILYLTQYFATPGQPGAARHYSHTRFLERRGNDVTVVTTSVLNKVAEVPRQHADTCRVVEDIEGVKVVRVRSSRRRRGFRGRLFHYLSFMWRAIWAGLRQRGRFDVVLASSPSLFVGLAGVVLSSAKSARFVLEVRDLWPESAVATGDLSNPLLIWISRCLERWLYRRASAIVCLTDGIAEVVGRTRQIGAKVVVVRNGVDATIFEERDGSACSSLRQRFPAKRLIVYSGAHGINNALDQVLDAASVLRDDPYQFLLVGWGDQTGRLKQRADEIGLGNVTFFGAVPRERVPDLLRCADVLVWPVLLGKESERLRNLKRGAVPNKLYDYLASGTPIVTSVPEDGEGALLIRCFGQGVFVDPSGEGFARGIQAVLGNPQAREERAAKAAEFRREYDRVGQAQRLLTVLERITRDTGGVASLPGQ